MTSDPHQLAPPTYFALQQPEQHYDYSYAYGTYGNDGQRTNVELVSQQQNHNRFMGKDEDEPAKLHQLPTKGKMVQNTEKRLRYSSEICFL